MYDETNESYITGLRKTPDLIAVGDEKLRTSSPKAAGRHFIYAGILDRPDVLYVGLKVQRLKGCVEYWHGKFSQELALFEHFTNLGYRVPRLMAFFDAGNVCGIWQEDLSKGGLYRIDDRSSYIRPEHYRELFGIEDRFDYELEKCAVSIHEREYRGENTRIGQALIDFDKMFYRLREPHRTALQQKAERFMSEDYVIRASGSSF